MVEIADSSGSDAGSITSWSITTDVSRSPLVGSVIDVLVYHHIEIGTKPSGVDAGRANRSFGSPVICKQISRIRRMRWSR